MRKQTLSLLVFAGVVFGCAAQQSALPPAPAPVLKTNAVAPTTAESTPSAAFERRIGDYVVHMISGTFRKQPALFSERVLGREDGAWIIELKLEDPTNTQILRAWLDDNGEVKKVTRLSDKGETPAKLADYEALLAAVSVFADENEGLTASTSGTCVVGPSELDCETKSYRVRIGEREASLGITQSKSLPGSDIAGEITAADGTVIFRSELVEHGNETPPAADSFALLDDGAPAAK